MRWECGVQDLQSNHELILNMELNDTKAQTLRHPDRYYLFSLSILELPWVRDETSLAAWGRES